MLSEYLDLIESECEQFKQNIKDISTFYLAAGLSAKLLAAIELPNGDALEMHMSYDFPLEATTIRDAEDVIALYRQGDYERLNAYQSVISLCSMFEFLVTELAEILSVSDRARRSISITSWRRQKLPIKIKNKTLCLVRAIHEAYEIDSQLNEDVSICWIYNFFLLRNIVVHEGGVLKEQKRNRLVTQWAKHPLDQQLFISGNHIDDMVHFLTSHVDAFVYQSRKKCGLA